MPTLNVLLKVRIYFATGRYVAYFMSCIWPLPLLSIIMVKLTLCCVADVDHIEHDLDELEGTNSSQLYKYFVLFLA